MVTADSNDTFFCKVVLNLLSDFQETYSEYYLLQKLAHESVLDGPWFMRLRQIIQDSIDNDKSVLGIGVIRSCISRRDVRDIIEEVYEVHPEYRGKIVPNETSRTLGELLELTQLETILLDAACRFTEMSYNHRLLLDNLDMRFKSPAELYAKMFGFPSKDGQKLMQGLLFNAGILVKNGASSPDGMHGLNSDLEAVFTNKSLKIEEIDEALFPHMLETSLVPEDYPHLEKEINRCIEVIEKNHKSAKPQTGINLMFWGMPGCGKSELVVALAKARGWNLKVIGDIAPNNLEENSRNSRIASLKLATKIYRTQPKTVLLFDEMEDLFKHDVNAQFSKAFINRIIETTNIPIIWTTNNLEMLGQPVLRRMTYNIGFKIPPEDVRAKMWKKYAEEYRLKIDEDAIKKIAKTYKIAPALIKNAVHVTSKAFGRKKVKPEDLTEIVSSLDTLVNYGEKTTIKEEYITPSTYDIGFVNADKDMHHFTDSILKAKRSGFALALYGQPGTGKCLDPNEPVLMHDGTSKLSRDLLVGDQLMGPDSKPRTVQSTSWGYGPMYEVRPKKGKTWKCNGDHILSLRASQSRYHGKIINVSVNDWLNWTDHQKHSWLLWRAAVDFQQRDEPKVDPYLIGLFLGDGSCSKTGTLSVHNIDHEITEYLRNQATELGMILKERQYGGVSCVDHAFVMGERGHNIKSSKLRNYLDDIDMFNSCADKFIPFVIKTGSRETRRRVLAGLMDTDGYYDTHGGVFDFISKSKQLSEDVCFVARSLGLAAYVSETFRRCQNGVGGTYYRVCLSGHLDMLPTLISRKQAKARTAYKDVTNVGFDIAPIGDGDWFGITLDDDHLYLLDDFTVTHNTEYGRHLAKLMGKEVLFKRASDLQSMWLGEAEKNIAKAFDEAKRRKMVLLIDEGDTFLRDRNKARQSWEVSQVNEMLSQMERHPEPFILTTNLMKDLDAAAMRRFTFKLQFHCMKTDQARALFKKMFGNDAPRDLDYNSMLAPGDFKNVKDQADILGITDSNEIWKMLDDETKMKPGHRSSIGIR